MMRRNTYAMAVLAATGFSLSPVRGSITGFSDFSGFTINQNDSGSPPTIPSSGAIELTTGNGQQRSIFTSTPQNITQFSASFTYQMSGNISYGGGVTFVLENDLRGASAVGNNNAGPEQSGFYQISPSVGVTFDLLDNSTGLFTDGVVSSGAASLEQVNLASGHPINIQLTYSGSTLSESVTDTVTSQSFSTTDLVIPSIASTVGSTTAFVGITSHGSNGTQTLSNFQFGAVPEPAVTSILLAGGVGILRRRRR